MSGRLAGVTLAFCGAAACAACGVVATATLSDAQEAIADLNTGPPAAKGGDLAIVGAVDHADRLYRVGEPIGLSVEVSQPAFVAVLRVMPNGATTLIFPNRRNAAARLPANAPLRFPEPAAPLTIKADQPGAVLFEFVASTRGDSWLFNPKPLQSADFVELGTTTHALAKDILIALKAGHGAAAAVTHLVVRVRGS